MILSSLRRRNKYAKLGGFRVAMNVLRYEVMLLLMALVVMHYRQRMSILDCSGGIFPLWVIFPPLLAAWLVAGLLELNRTPFDLAEGERELVSGINVEYGGMGFVAFYLPEYGNMMLFSYVTCCFLF